MEEYILGLAVLVTGLMIIAIGYWTKKKPPKKINGLYGYRTGRAMRSQEAWDFAQDLAPREMIKSGWYLILLALVTYFLDTSKDWVSYLVTIAIIVIIFVPIYIVERQLIKRFG